jgi:hypothetical protein
MVGVREKQHNHSINTNNCNKINNNNNYNNNNNINNNKYYQYMVAIINDRGVRTA